MSMTLVNAKTYVARIIGGASSQESLDMAAEAISRGYTDWQAQKFWRFLLKDTSSSTAVTGVTATAASATVSAPSVGAFDFVNVGQTVTIAAADTATLVAGTTVSSFVRGTDGVITTITLSNAFGGTTDTSSTLTFSADIPIIIGTNEYNLPLDYNAAAVGLFTVTPRKLEWRTQEYWDRIQPNFTLTGQPSEFTSYNPVSEITQNYGETRLKFDRIPDATDLMRLRYFRRFNTSATTIDIPDELLYKFLDYARSLLLEAKRAADNPGEYRDSVIDGMKQAEINDEDRNSESDVDDCIKSQYEMWSLGERLPWSNGDFDPTR